MKKKKIQQLEDNWLKSARQCRVQFLVWLRVHVSGQLSYFATTTKTTWQKLCCPCTVEHTPATEAACAAQPERSPCFLQLESPVQQEDPAQPKIVQ